MNHNQLFSEIAKDICKKHRTTFTALRSNAKRTPGQILAIQEIAHKFKHMGTRYIAERICISLAVLYNILERAQALRQEQNREILQPWSASEAFAPKSANEIIASLLSL